MIMISMDFSNSHTTATWWSFTLLIGTISAALSLNNDDKIHSLAALLAKSFHL